VFTCCICLSLTLKISSSKTNGKLWTFQIRGKIIHNLEKCDIIQDPFSPWLSLRRFLCCVTTSFWRSLFENHMIDIILWHFLYDTLYFTSSEWHYLVTLSILRHLSGIVYFISSEWHCLFYVIWVTLNCDDIYVTLLRHDG